MTSKIQFAFIGGAVSAFLTPTVMLLLASVVNHQAFADISYIFTAASVVTLFYLLMIGLFAYFKHLPTIPKLTLIVGLLIWVSFGLQNLMMSGLGSSSLTLLNLGIAFVVSMILSFGIPKVGAFVVKKLKL